MTEHIKDIASTNDLAKFILMHEGTTFLLPDRGATAAASACASLSASTSAYSDQSLDVSVESDKTCYLVHNDKYGQVPLSFNYWV